MNAGEELAHVELDNWGRWAAQRPPEVPHPHAYSVSPSCRLYRPRHVSDSATSGPPPIRPSDAEALEFCLLAMATDPLRTYLYEVARVHYVDCRGWDVARRAARQAREIRRQTGAHVGGSERMYYYRLRDLRTEVARWFGS